VYRPTQKLAALLVLGLAACASQAEQHIDQTSPETVATPAQTVVPSASPAVAKHRASFARVVALQTPSATPTQVPSAPPTPAPTATPSSSPTPVARKHVVVPMRAPEAPPQIVDVEMNTNDVGSGDTLWGKVLTSSNVASVEVRVGNIGIGLNKVGVGRFMLAYRLGSIPLFVHGTYPMHIIARNSRGEKTERTLPLTIH